VNGYAVDVAFQKTIEQRPHPAEAGNGELPYLSSHRAGLRFSMYHLLYVSSAVNLFTDAQLDDLLRVSRHNNSSCGVTGMLLYVGGNFIQLLEGEKEVVQATHLRIAHDPRHHGLITLLQGDCDKREFSEWSMGFKKAEKANADGVAGYSDFLQGNGDEPAHRSAAMKLFFYFKNNNH
jgi:hypothetical protein